MFARAEITAGADCEAAEGLSAKLACSARHFGLIIGILWVNCYDNAGNYLFASQG
jgi:hypothetical protein